MTLIMRPTPLLLILPFVGLAAAGCVADGDLKRPDGFEPSRRNDGWEVASPEEAGIRASTLDALYDRFYAEDDFYNAVSLLVVRHGRLVAEGYAKDPYDRHRVHHLQSITKSVTSLVFGVLHERGVFPNLDETLRDILPSSSFEGDPRARSITLRHLLTMSSGLDYDNTAFSIDLLMLRPGDQDREILSRKMYADPGAEFRYRDADPQLLSYAIQDRTGRTLADLADELLFRPLRINDYRWQENVDGVTLGAHALWLQPRDMAKIGQLVLNGGLWNGERLVSEEWIDASTTTKVMPDAGDPDIGGFGYGYYWWVIPDLPGFTAWGHGGQYILVVPEADLVVVLTASPDADYDVGKSLKQFVPLIEVLLQGIQEE